MPAPSPTPAPTASKIVTFPDGALEAAIIIALGKPAGEAITSAELAGLTELTTQDPSDASGAQDASLDVNSGGSAGSAGDGGVGGAAGLDASAGSGGQAGKGGDASIDNDAPGEACATTNLEMRLKPLDMYFMIDRSGSMSGNPWTDEKSALNTFWNDAGSAGITAALRFFPYSLKYRYPDYSAPGVLFIFRRMYNGLPLIPCVYDPRPRRMFCFFVFHNILSSLK